jgi:nucleotide-binding universal stress UspA family protein
MFRTILVPLDGSAFAEQVLPLALTIARRAQANLNLVRVRPSLPLNDAATAAEEYLNRVAGQIGPELPGRISCTVLTQELGPLAYPPPLSNSVADVLAQYTEEHDIDLVLMTTHGRGGVRRAWLGSAADAFMRIAPRPVLLIRPKDENFTIAADADRGINHIVIPLDGSEAAERAMPFAEQLGGIFAARYTLLRVVSPFTFDVSPEWYGVAPAEPPSPLNREAAVRYLDEVATRLRETQKDVAAHVIEAASPAGAIIDHAGTHGADLIALSSSGAGGIRRVLLGSVADKIIRGADVPVLVCNTRHMEPPESAGAMIAAAGEARD